MKPRSSLFKILFAVLGSVLFNCGVGVGFAMATDTNPLTSMIVLNGIGVIRAEITDYIGLPVMTGGIAMAGLNREVWLSRVLLTFRMDSAWLKDVSDLTAFVDNDNINLAAAGVDPDVVYNYASSSGDIGSTTSTEDTAVVVPLGSISTKKDFVDSNLQAMRQYNIMGVKTERHIKTMSQKILLKGAYAIAPSSAVANKSFIINATGSIDSVTGFRITTLADVIALRQKYLEANMNGKEGVNEGQPVLVLTPQDQAYLQAEDKVLFKKFLDQAPNLPFELFGFKTYVSTAVPRYNGHTGGKVAFGASALSTDVQTSFSFLPDRVGRAEGTTNMFLLNNDPSIQGHTFNFSKRFFVGQIDGYGVGAIVRRDS